MAQSRGDAAVLHRDMSPSPSYSLVCLGNRDDLVGHSGEGDGDWKLEELSKQPKAKAAHWWDPHAPLCMGSPETWLDFGLPLPLAF